MITKKHLQRINLRVPPWPQIVVAQTLLKFDYSFPRKTTIILENLDYIPKNQAVIYALNHTDRYNYWPFMYQLWQEGGYAFTSPWVKGKYYQNPLMARFFDMTNNIPLPSRGYVITKHFQKRRKRLPTKTEYRLLRDLVDAKINWPEFYAEADEALKKYVTKPQWGFKSKKQDYVTFIEDKFSNLMGLVTQISEEALLKKNLSLLIFPQGTRSIRLLPGQTGIAQIALKMGVPVIPVGCNGCDKCYQGAMPFSAGGTIVYRIGKPLTLEDDLAPYAIYEPFEPFTRLAKEQFEPNFRGATDLIMERINTLLDPPYQFAEDATALAENGVRRFV